MKKVFKRITRILVLLFSIAALLALITFVYMMHPTFGAKAEGKRLERMLASPNYKNGVFVNRSFTPLITKGYSMRKVSFDFIFNKSARAKPKGIIPSVQTDLKNLPQGDWLVWFGHSSYLIQTDGLKILVDPVFSGNASPVPGTTKAFKGSNTYQAEDMPEIDYLFISHDHYDHLDYETMLKLKAKVKKVICGLGVGAHLERWGYAPENIIELDWDTNTDIPGGGKIFGLTARHFSGRGFRRNGTLWIAYLLQTPTRKIFIGGDGGYDKHFKGIGELHGPIDFAILENGQYNPAWSEIHFLPGENVQAAIELKAKRVFPVHSSKFDLALHDWDEPLNEFSRRIAAAGISLATPKIGEPVNLNDATQKFTEWWKDVDPK
jgi:L-ascorbate metabolism protein UlaG (beta-lactamase superfamily)